MLGKLADVMMWDQHGPPWICLDYEVGAHDGTYKCRAHTIVHYIGRKILNGAQQK